MSGDLELELSKALRSHDDRYDYFLLAAAGASIAFALNQTKGLSLSSSQVSLGVAVISWALSFFTGCLRLHGLRGALYANAWLAKAQSDPELGMFPEMQQQMVEKTRGNFDRQNNAAGAFGRWQFTFLIIGAVAYIGWHVTEMYLRTVKH